MKVPFGAVFFFLFLFLFLFIPIDSPAVPAYPGLIKFVQPDQSSLTLRLQGDEFFHWAESADGYTLLLNDSGLYEYAVVNDRGELVPSGVRATDQAERTAADEQLLSETEKQLTYSPKQISILKQISAVYTAEQQKAFPTTGNRRLVCILIGYTDKAFILGREDFQNLFNQVGYGIDGASGSVKDYYLENSWGQLALDVTVAGPYTAAGNMAYYGANDASGYDLRPRELVDEAVHLADPDVDYADFDNDGDGTVDGVYVIFAGYGEEAGASADAIWSHAWSIPTVTLDGIHISRYSCSPELRGNAGSGISRIGVICHEFGHVLGAPDYYDTDYDIGGRYSGTGQWDLMAAGSWNNSGATPAHHNAFTKSYYYNWASMTELTLDQPVTVPNIEDNQAIYLYRTPSTNEYWLLENRQQTGFDAALPGHGLLIYHVDQDEVDGHYSANTINATHPQYMYPVNAGAATEPSADPASYGTINSGGCPYPGTTGATQFTDQTTPSSTDWSGQATNRELTGIAENAGVITFTFVSGGSNPTGFSAAPVSAAAVDLSWGLNPDSDDVLLAWSPDGIFGIPVDGTTYSAGDTLIGGGTVLSFGPTTSYPHSGLSADTTYYYKAWSYDGAAYSIGTTANATTLCSPVASFPWSGNFDDAIFPPRCMRGYQRGDTAGWTRSTVQSRSAPAAAYHNDDDVISGVDDWLVSPAFDFSGKSSVSLSFWQYQNYSSWYHYHGVMVSTDSNSDPDNGTWTQVHTGAGPEDAWQEVVVDLSSYAGQANVHIAFQYTGDYADQWWIDDVTVLAESLVLQHELVVTVSGSGSGQVTGTGISCPGDCSESYDAGTLVTLTAVEDTGSRFAGWSGDADCADGQVRMDGARNCTATFIRQHDLTVALAGSGSGQVTGTGISCPGDCSETYDADTVVVLEALEDTGSAFMGWTGACSGNSDCPLTMDQEQEVTATFTDLAAPVHELAVLLTGNGSGSITTEPPGIFCGSAGNTCTAPFDDNATVTLIAAADPGSSFGGWSGVCSGTTLQCTLPMDQAKSVSGDFFLQSFTLSLSKAGDGQGTVSSLPAGIDCGMFCSEAYQYGTTVVLTAEPERHTNLAGWQGSCIEADPAAATCTVIIRRDEEIRLFLDYQFPWNMFLPSFTSGRSGK